MPQSTSSFPKLVPLLLVLVGISLRLLPHPPNFVPITAIALLAGSKFPKKLALLLPLAIMLLSDAAIGFYDPWVMGTVYLSFIITSLIGIVFLQTPRASRLLATSLASSLLFFLTTNLAVWVSPASPYTQDFSGLLKCFALALPFFRNTLAGDIFYTTVLFGLYYLLRALSKRLLPPKILRLAF